MCRWNETKEAAQNPGPVLECVRQVHGLMEDGHVQREPRGIDVVILAKGPMEMHYADDRRISRVLPAGAVGMH